MQVAGISFLAIAATVIVIIRIIRLYLFLDKFRPVRLNDEEHAGLVSKLERIGMQVEPRQPDKPEEALKPEPYSKVHARRNFRLSEKELNALIAATTDLGTIVVMPWLTKGKMPARSCISIS